MNIERRREVFARYGSIYKTILSGIYPAKNSTGFPERNLSVNFSKAYEAAANLACETAFSWFELQFGPSNNFHVDTVIINRTAGDMLIVESKRFSHPSEKTAEIIKDIERIYHLVSELQHENQEGIFRIDMSKIRRCYGAVLADVWTESRLKTDIVNSYCAGVRDPASPDSFLNKYCGDSLQVKNFTDLTYDVRSMKEIESVQRYHLVSFLWEIL